MVHTIPAATFNNNNCSIDLYSRDLQTTIIHFIRKVSSHKTDWILTELLLPALFCLLYCKVRSDECIWKRISLPLRNLHRCKQVVYAIVVCVFCLHLSLQCFYCLFTSLSLLFYTDVVSIFWFIRWSCKQVHCFVFVAFVYHFRSNISIFLTLF